MSPLDRLFARRMIVCVGPGGVGKTTVSAALALAAARRGGRTLVVTIDPTRRLADALGLDPASDELVEVRAPGIERGALRAVMLEPKRAFDDLVDRLAPDAATREAVHANAIYQHVSDQLAGSAEYAAMVRVHELATRDDVDLLLIDTPPSAHALDFLDAPARLSGLLESAIVQWLVHPAASVGRFGWRVFQRGTHGVLRTLERVTGLGFLEDVSEFLLTFESMTGGFRDRAREVEALLFGPDCAFVLVTGPSATSVAQTEAFRRRLEERGIAPAALVLNRVRAWPSGVKAPAPATGDPIAAHPGHAALASALAGEFGARANEAASAAYAILDGYALGVASDRAAVGPLLECVRGAGAFTRCIPELPGDVHDLGGLATVEAALLTEDCEES